MGNRAGTLVGAVVAVAAMVVGSAVPSGAAGWPPPPATTAGPPGTATYLHMVSTGDDSIGLGRNRTWTYVPAEADFTVTSAGGDIDINVVGDTWWDVLLRPTSPQAAVTEGRHEGTARAVVSGDGRGCGDAHTRGWYEVDDVAYDGGELVRLAVRFAQWCDDKDESRAMHGEVRWDAAAPIPGAPTPVGPAPGSFWRPTEAPIPPGGGRNHLVMESDPGDFVGQGQVHSYTGFTGQLYQGAFTLVHPELSWRVSLQPSNRAPHGLEAGFYPQLLREAFPNPVRGGFDVGGNSRGCNRSSADVVVDRVDARGGTYRDIAFRFEQHCEYGSAALRGQVVWQAPVPPGTAGPPTAVTAERSGSTATVRWTAPSTTGASPVSGYEVVAYRDGTAVGQTITAPATATSVQVPIPAGHRWSFTVAATNGQGTGRRSAMTGAVGATAPDLGPFASLEALITQQHQDLLGRAPTAAEVRDAASLIRSGTVTPAGWIAGMVTRPEWGGRRAPIIRLYAAAFLRPVDAAGLEYWAERRRTGTSLRTIAQGFAASPELRARYGTLTNAEFVDRIYRNVLGRRPEGAGLAYWTARLDGGTSRGEVLLRFSEAPENRQRRAQLVTVTLLTTGMLDRAPAVDEVNVGGDPEGLALHHLTRAEYRHRIL